MGIWAIRSPLKIHCYTCMSFKTCWSRLIYTKLSSHRSFVINMYVITMAWRCISPWSFHRSLQRRREMDIFHICQQISTFWSKNNNNKKKTKKKEENLDWTLVNTENLRARCPSGKRIATSSPLFSILFSRISFTSLKKDEYNAISRWFTREEVEGLFNFSLRRPAH